MVRRRPVARLTTDSTAMTELLRATERPSSPVVCAGPASTGDGMPPVASMSTGEPAGAAPIAADASPSGPVVAMGTETAGATVAKTTVDSGSLRGKSCSDGPGHSPAVGPALASGRWRRGRSGAAGAYGDGGGDVAGGTTGRTTVSSGSPAACRGAW